jgi:hypothetical protein
MWLLLYRCDYGWGWKWLSLHYMSNLIVTACAEIWAEAETQLSTSLDT